MKKILKNAKKPENIVHIEEKTQKMHIEAAETSFYAEQKTADSLTFLSRTDRMVLLTYGMQHSFAQPGAGKAAFLSCIFRVLFHWIPLHILDSLIRYLHSLYLRRGCCLLQQRIRIIRRLG
ncbi:MAG: hypothetical protein IJL88_02180 [Clostridia bacterium]|nr:hypothetical protein [Clostridia bacterium]